MNKRLSQFEAEALKLAVDNQLAEKGLGALARLWDLGHDIDGGTPDRPNKPYSQNSWVYSCVNAIIRACRSIPMMLSDASDNIIESGPAWDFFFGNPAIPFTKFLTETVGFFTLYREVYWVFLDKDVMAPKSVLVAGPNTLNPVIRSGVLVGYELQQLDGRRVPLFLDDVYPLLDFNPDSAHRGIGPAVAGKLAISSSYQASLLNEATLANGGKIGNLITTPGKLDPDERRMLIAQFESRHKGARNAGRTCLMTGGADVKQLAQTMAELQMLDLRKYDASEICVLFDVPPEVLGINPEAQYAHGPAHQRFIANNIASTLSFIAEHITSGILGRFKNRKHLPASSFKSKLQFSRKSQGYRQAAVRASQQNQSLFAWFAVEQHPAMQAMLRERIEKVIKYTEKGITLNDCIDAFDLPFQHYPWGDDWWIPMGQVPARFTLEAGLEGITGPSLPEGEEEPEKSVIAEIVSPALPEITVKDSEQQRLRTWRNWVTSWAGIERQYTQALRVLFVRQQRILIEKLKAALEAKAVKNIDDIIARVVFDLKAENGKLKVINHTFFEKASELGVRQSLTELLALKKDELAEMTGHVMRMPVVKGKLIISTSRITKTNRTTQRLVARQLRAGLESGEGLNELTSRIKKTLGSNRARALGIARTQTAGAVDTGRHFGMKAAGVELKSWLTSRDSDVRDTHRSAESKYAAGIALDVPFVVGGEFLMYPGDPAGTAAEIINCRCVEIARAIGGKTIDLSHYKAFYSYCDMQRDKETNNAT